MPRVSTILVQSVGAGVSVTTFSSSITGSSVLVSWLASDGVVGFGNALDVSSIGGGASGALADGSVDLGGATATATLVGGSGVLADFGCADGTALGTAVDVRVGVATADVGAGVLVLVAVGAGGVFVFVADGAGVLVGVEAGLPNATDCGPNS